MGYGSRFRGCNAGALFIVRFQLPQLTSLWCAFPLGDDLAAGVTVRMADVAGQSVEPGQADAGANVITAVTGR